MDDFGASHDDDERRAHDFQMTHEVTEQEAAKLDRNPQLIREIEPD